MKDKNSYRLPWTPTRAPLASTSTSDASYAVADLSPTPNKNCGCCINRADMSSLYVVKDISTISEGRSEPDRMAVSNVKIVWIRGVCNLRLERCSSSQPISCNSSLLTEFKVVAITRTPSVDSRHQRISTLNSGANCGHFSRALSVGHARRHDLGVWVSHVGSL